MSAWQVMGCHSRASETAAEQIQPDKLKSGYGQKSDWVAFFFFFFLKNSASRVYSVSNLLPSPAEGAFCSRCLTDATWSRDSELESCIFNGIIT